MTGIIERRKRAMARKLREHAGDEVREILAGPGPVVALQSRDARGMLREVFLVQGRYVAKRYTSHDAPPPERQPWEREHRALVQLCGHNAPRPVGFIEEWIDGTFRATLVRSYVAGTHVGELDTPLVAHMARSIAAIHGHRVITEDAHRRNFVRREDGELAFVDFGKARCFGRWNALLYAGIAFDLHRLYRAALDRDERLWSAFLDAYFEATPFTGWRQTVIRALLAVERRRYRWVKGG